MTVEYDIAMILAKMESIDSMLFDLSERIATIEAKLYGQERNFPKCAQCGGRHHPQDPHK